MANKRLELSFNQAKEIQHFTSKKDFNTSLEMHLADHKKAFTASEYLALKRLMKIACNAGRGIYGVAFASIRYIISQIQKLDVFTGVSESTFQRMKRKAIKLGILEIIQRYEENGRSTTNLIVFKKYGAKKQAEIVPASESIDTPQTEAEQPEALPEQGEVFKQLTPLDTGITSNTNIIKPIKTRSESVSAITELDSSFMVKNIPAEFIRFVKNFYDDAEKIEAFWHRVELADKKHRLNCTESLTRLSIDSFKVLVRKIKLNAVKDEMGFFYGVVSKQIKREQRSQKMARLFDAVHDFYTETV